VFYPSCVVALGAAAVVGYETNQPFRHTVLAVVRCSRVGGE
jgi:aarF domain-containing kinase